MSQVVISRKLTDNFKSACQKYVVYFEESWQIARAEEKGKQTVGPAVMKLKKQRFKRDGSVLMK